MSSRPYGRTWAGNGAGGSGRPPHPAIPWARRFPRGSRRVRAPGDRPGPRHHPGQHQSSRTRADGHRPHSWSRSTPTSATRPWRRIWKRKWRRCGGPSSGAGHGHGSLTGKNISETREWILPFPRPIGTVPIYRRWKGPRTAGRLTWEIYRDVLIEQCEQGWTTSPFTPPRCCASFPDRAAGHRHRLPRRQHPGQVCWPITGKTCSTPIGTTSARSWPPTREHFHRGRPAPRLDCRCQRRSAIRELRFRGTDPARLGPRGPGDERRPAMFPCT